LAYARADQSDSSETKNPKKGRVMNYVKTCIMVFALSISGVSLAHATCSNASIKGTYGVLSTGLNGSLQPASSVDQVTLDGAGHLSGTSTKSINGTIVTFPFTGTYALGTTCNGTAIFTQSGQTEHDNIYVNNANAGAFLIQTDKTHVQSSISVAQGAATCTNLGVKNPYSFEATGQVIGTGQIAGAGRLTMNGTGGISGKLTLSLNGTIHSSVTVTGTYTINSNCTGTATITPTGLSTMNFNLVVVNAGKEIMAIETDNNTIVTGTFQE
jgi:hypothetical protein